MKAVLWRGCLPVFAVTLLLTYSAPAEAQNLALGKPVIDQSSRWNNQAQYDGQMVTDGFICELNQQEEGPGMSSYWIAAEGQLGEWVTVDLLAPTLITEIDLRNTHNAFFNDRGTADFVIDADTAVDANNQLVNPVTILSATLSNVDGYCCPLVIPPDKFNANNGLMTGGQAFRYLRFTALSAQHPGNDVGLNEIEVFGSQDDPPP